MQVSYYKPTRMTRINMAYFKHMFSVWFAANGGTGVGVLDIRSDQKPCHCENNVDGHPQNNGDLHLPAEDSVLEEKDG
jgi:hypothetical protein